MADLLFGLAAILLGIKLAATLILLRRAPATRLASRSGVRLWWATKLTPLIAVPCLIAVARLQHDLGGLLVYSLLMAFVVIAVPVTIWRQRGRATRLRSSSAGHP